jgi:hypothetical protein
MFNVHERTLCPTCAEDFFRGHVGTKRAVRHVDPTVCVNCGADNGDTPHGQLMKLPTCGQCIDFYRNRPFPGWVKASFAAILVLVIVSLAWNWRFFQAHFEIKAAWAAMAKGDAKTAAAKMSAAAAHVPEAPDLDELAALFQGLLCLEEDKCADAEACFARCARLPPEFQVAALRQQAAAGAAFDRKDYDRFLQVAEDIARQQPRDAIARAQVASALACQYAVRGEPELRRRAEAKLEEAKQMDSAALQAGRYEERIRHRLQTREVISGQEFLKRFPNGWKPDGAAKS